MHHSTIYIQHQAFVYVINLNNKKRIIMQKIKLHKDNLNPLILKQLIYELLLHWKLSTVTILLVLTMELLKQIFILSFHHIIIIAAHCSHNCIMNRNVLMSKLDMKESRETHVTALEQPKGQNLFLSLTTTKKKHLQICVG